MPGSYNGHDSDIVSFFAVGGKIENGRAFLRLAIPATQANADLINACKMGVQQFSNVVHCEIIDGEYGEEQGTPQIDAVKEGRLEQEIMNSNEEKVIMDLIARGKIDYIHENGESIINGKVSKVWAVKNQNGHNKAVAGRVLNAIARSKKMLTRKYFNAEGEPSGIATEDAIEALKVAVSNNTISVDEIIEKVGAREKVATEEQKNAVKSIEEIRAFLELPENADAEKSIQALDDLKKIAEETSAATAEIEANRLCPEGKLVNGKENPAWKYAHGKIAAARNAGDREKVVLAFNADAIFTALKHANAVGAVIEPSKKKMGIWV
jgi:hypothetical protein